MGVTCSGKTALLNTLSKHRAISIINADSAAIYRHLDIGTSKPSLEERAATPYYLIDILEPQQHYNVRQFIADCDQSIADILAQGRIPIVSGGTLFYAKALMQGIHDLPETNMEYRRQLELDYQLLGGLAMHQRLMQLDAQTAERIPAQNRQRLIRAIELVETTGKTLQQLYTSADLIKSRYHLSLIGLSIQNRQLLAKKIALRFDNMLSAGLEAEVRNLCRQFTDFALCPAAKLVGYKEMLQYVQQRENYDRMRDLAIIATRQLAKRQMTWIRNWKCPMHTIFADCNNLWQSSEQLADQFSSIIQSQL